MNNYLVRRIKSLSYGRRSFGDTVNTEVKYIPYKERYIDFTYFSSIVKGTHKHPFKLKGIKSLKGKSTASIKESMMNTYSTTFTLKYARYKIFKGTIYGKGYDTEEEFENDLDLVLDPLVCIVVDCSHYLPYMAIQNKSYDDLIAYTQHVNEYMSVFVDKMLLTKQHRLLWNRLNKLEFFNSDFNVTFVENLKTKFTKEIKEPDFSSIQEMKNFNSIVSAKTIQHVISQTEQTSWTQLGKGMCKAFGKDVQ